MDLRRPVVHVAMVTGGCRVRRWCVSVRQFDGDNAGWDGGNRGDAFVRARLTA